MSKKAKKYEVSGFKFAGLAILFLLLYFMLFILLGVELRQQGYPMRTVDITFYIGLVLTLVGCVLFSIERKKE